MSRDAEMQADRLAQFIVMNVPEEQWERNGLWSMDLRKLSELRKEYMEVQASVSAFKRRTPVRCRRMV